MSNGNVAHQFLLLIKGTKCFDISIVHGWWDKYICRQWSYQSSDNCHINNDKYICQQWSHQSSGKCAIDNDCDCTQYRLSCALLCWKYNHIKQVSVLSPVHSVYWILKDKISHITKQLTHHNSSQHSRCNWCQSDRTLGSLPLCLCHNCK